MCVAPRDAVLDTRPRTTVIAATDVTGQVTVVVGRGQRRGLVACLFASPDTILQRTKGNANRPLLNVENPRQRIAELLSDREPIYLQAGACFYTDAQPMAEIVRHLERFYQRESRKFGK